VSALDVGLVPMASWSRCLSMIILGLILLIIGFVAGIGILVTAGIIICVIGLILLLVGTVGHHAVGGRSHWF
jgi:membrane-bound ClpP family serine protease